MRPTDCLHEFIVSQNEHIMDEIVPIILKHNHVLTIIKASLYVYTTTNDTHYPTSSYLFLMHTGDHYKNCKPAKKLI